jgi:hypothetical protein
MESERKQREKYSIPLSNKNPYRIPEKMFAMISHPEGNLIEIASDFWK